MSSKRVSKVEGEFDGKLVILNIPFTPIFAVCKLPDREIPIISREVEPIHRGDLKVFDGITYRCIGKTSALVLKGQRAQDFKPTYHFEII